VKGWFRDLEDTALMTSTGLLFTAATCCSPYLEGVVALRSSIATEIAKCRLNAGQSFMLDRFRRSADD
jgi:hypothetical protein